MVDLPIVHGTDATYVRNMRHSYHLFFRIPEEQLPWIAVVGPDGAGLVHASTRRLFGRKMFAWGSCAGTVSSAWNPSERRPRMFSSRLILHGDLNSRLMEQSA